MLETCQVCTDKDAVCLIGFVHSLCAPPLPLMSSPFVHEFWLPTDLPKFRPLGGGV